MIAFVEDDGEALAVARSGDGVARQRLVERVGWERQKALGRARQLRLQFAAQIEHRDVAQGRAARFGQCGRGFGRACGVRECGPDGSIAIELAAQIERQLLGAFVVEARGLGQRMGAIIAHLNESRGREAAADEDDRQGDSDADVARNSPHRPRQETRERPCSPDYCSTLGHEGQRTPPQ